MANPTLELRPLEAADWVTAVALGRLGRCLGSHLRGQMWWCPKELGHGTRRRRRASFRLSHLNSLPLIHRFLSLLSCDLVHFPAEHIAFKSSLSDKRFIKWNFL
jgi:hypothetical protein